MPLPYRILTPDGEWYRLVVMRVEDTRDDLPRVNGYEVPSGLMFIDEQDVVEVCEGARFVTAYVSE